MRFEIAITETDGRIGIRIYKQEGLPPRHAQGNVRICGMPRLESGRIYLRGDYKPRDLVYVQRTKGSGYGGWTTKRIVEEIDLFLKSKCEDVSVSVKPIDPNIEYYIWTGKDCNTPRTIEPCIQSGKYNEDNKQYKHPTVSIALGSR